MIDPNEPKRSRKERREARKLEARTGRPPAFSSRMNVETGFEIGLPIMLAGLFVLYAAYRTGLGGLWAIGGGIAGLGIAVLLRNKRF